MSNFIYIWYGDIYSDKTSKDLFYLSIRMFEKETSLFLFLFLSLSLYIYI